jgi:hypothetical protein
MNHFEKTRIWDAELKTWYTPTFNRNTGELSEIYLSQNGELVLRQISALGVQTFAHLQQTDPPRYIKSMYTGTRDKDGNKLFFNDIIAFPNEGDGSKSYGVLIWMGARLGIGSGPIDNYSAEDSITEQELRKAEKAGNIYEHAHLIQGDFS